MHGVAYMAREQSPEASKKTMRLKRITLSNKAFVISAVNKPSAAASPETNIGLKRDYEMHISFFCAQYQCR